jgi:hypothetical protein
MTLRTNRKQSILINRLINFSFFLLFGLAGCSSKAEETFWLTHIAAPYKIPEKIYPNLENPADKTGDVSAITIKDNKLIFNGEWCNYDIEKIKPFNIDRTLADTIDDAGGQKKFLAFLQTKLKTDMAKWKTEYFVKRSDKYLDNQACVLLQNGAIYRTSTQLIIWDSVFFYSFALGKDFKY